jgi:hypothetical protein
MNRRITVLSAALTIALVLGIKLGTPKITQAVANATPPSINTTSDIASATPPSIDTTPYWDGVEYISSFGMPNTATYGQTISMTEGSATLTQFSFFMAVTPTAVFRGFVFGWDGSKATGTPLFESAPMSTTQGVNFEEVVFNIPNGMVLNADQQYVLFASTSIDPAQPNSAGKWGAIITNTVYSGGQFVYLNNGDNPSLWTSTAWSTIAQDLAFKATLVKPATIDTTLYWDRVEYISSFGMPNTATYGQTISMTEGSATLTQFSFFMAVTPTAVFRGFVFGWDGTNSRATGTPLFESAPMSTTQGVNFGEVVFNIPNGIALNAGQQYVLFASTSKDPAQPNSAGRWGAVVTNTVYSGGQFVFLNNGSDPTKWTSTTWSTIARDLAFKATLHWQVFLPLIMRP